MGLSLFSRTFTKIESIKKLVESMHEISTSSSSYYLQVTNKSPFCYIRVTTHFRYREFSFRENKTLKKSLSFKKRFGEDAFTLHGYFHIIDIEVR